MDIEESVYSIESKYEQLCFDLVCIHKISIDNGGIQDNLSLRQIHAQR